MKPTKQHVVLLRVPFSVGLYAPIVPLTMSNTGFAAALNTSSAPEAFSRSSAQRPNLGSIGYSDKRKRDKSGQS
jgi:hypothetical protein